MGDTIVATKPDRLARSVRHLSRELRTISSLVGRGNLMVELLNLSGFIKPLRFIVWAGFQFISEAGKSTHYRGVEFRIHSGNALSKLATLLSRILVLL